MYFKRFQAFVEYFLNLNKTSPEIQKDYLFYTEINFSK
jgi:hypothetical protein